MIRARVVATPCEGRDLAPGELFSTAGPEYWAASSLGTSPDPDPSIGECVYVRTNTPTPPAIAHERIFRIQIVLEAVGPGEGVRVADPAGVPLQLVRGEA